MTDPNQQEPYTLKLSHDEELVLFEFLARCVTDGRWTVEDTAEWNVLSFILAELEVRLVEPFADDYLELLEAARASLRPEDMTLDDIIKK